MGLYRCGGGASDKGICLITTNAGNSGTSLVDLTLKRVDGYTFGYINSAASLCYNSIDYLTPTALKPAWKSSASSYITFEVSKPCTLKVTYVDIEANANSRTYSVNGEVSNIRDEILTPPVTSFTADYTVGTFTVTVTGHVRGTTFIIEEV